jgi:aspartate/methionine/tyrosine aminotransferase
MDATEELSAHLQTYRRNRDTVMEALRGLGISRMAPADGAFYVYADVSHLTRDSLEFCKQLLADTGVAFNTGLDFDPLGGGSTLRISFAVSSQEAEEAMRRFGDWLARR